MNTNGMVALLDLIYLTAQPVPRFMRGCARENEVNGW